MVGFVCSSINCSKSVTNLDSPIPKKRKYLDTNVPSFDTFSFKYGIASFSSIIFNSLGGPGNTMKIVESVSTAPPIANPL